MYNEQDYEAYAKMMEEKYPKMFAKPYGGFAIGQGWWVIVERLCAHIQHHIDWKNETRERLLKDNPYKQKIPKAVPQVVVAQIKEKFGGLRFYYDGGDETIDGMVQMAESWAGHACEDCGKPGKQRDGGWIRTLCDEHEAEYQKRQAER